MKSLTTPVRRSMRATLKPVRLVAPVPGGMEPVSAMKISPLKPKASVREKSNISFCVYKISLQSSCIVNAAQVAVFGADRRSPTRVTTLSLFDAFDKEMVGARFQWMMCPALSTRQSPRDDSDNLQRS